PGALVDPQGASVSGQVEVFLTPIDASDPEEQQAAPGALQAVDGQEQPQKLESFGMMDIAIRQEGRSLELAPGQSMDIQIPAVAQMEEEPPETMPLWSFDEDTAVWRQEGDMTWDAASDTWSANITRMASWNADRVQETTCIRGLVIDEDTGEPLPGAAVLGFGVDYQSSDATWTDAQGRFVLLVRTSSTTRVEALHDPNGGQTRDIDSGDQIAQQPANLDDTACTDVGEWRIKRGEVLTPPSGNNNGGMAAICDLPALDAIRTCLPTMTALFTCHNPVGSCELVGGGLGGYRYDNGARAETDFDLGLGQLTTTYYGPDETLCGSQTIDTSTLEIRVELADGTVGTFSGSTGGAGEAITYTCEGGESFVLDARTQAILAACSGDSESCDPGEGTSNGGVSLGQMCAQPSDCGDGDLVCCLGTCLTQDLCAVPICEQDSDCGGGQVCCASALTPDQLICQSYAACNQGACRDANDCQVGELCCDSACVGNRPFCEGFCAQNSDCGEGGYCCTGSDGTYCTEDERTCLEGSTCAQDGDCGADLVCCDGFCETVDTCYSGEPCSAAEPCQGGLTCCERNGVMVCLTDEVCNTGQTCQDDAQCGQGLICCDRPDLLSEGSACLSETDCFVGRMCTADAECGPLLCCDLGIGEPLCFEGSECP
ncbi:MAG: carboxypeptidase-like regulatory domain-containing protein, partial [Myxococcota bacterium]